jgi:hypothetical protein
MKKIIYLLPVLFFTSCTSINEDLNGDDEEVVIAVEEVDSVLTDESVMYLHPELID